MTDSPEPPSEIHPVALLLPWYLAGRLSEPERLEVEGHLTGCTDCRNELDSLAALRQQSRDMFVRAPGPSPRVKRSVMSEVRGRAVEPRFLDRLANASLDLLRPKWASSLVLLLIICQFGALAWLAIRPSTPPALTSRSVSQAAARLKIVFSPAAAERDVHNAIRELGGHIVDGPTSDGAYIVEITGGSPQLIGAKLRALRERPGLVERIENAPP